MAPGQLRKRVNDAIVEVTGTPVDQLSVQQFRHLVKTREHVPLPVRGVPGLSLHVQRAPVVEGNAPEKWSAVFTVNPPDSGTGSFDRLAAAIGPASTTTSLD